MVLLITPTCRMLIKLMSLPWGVQAVQQAIPGKQTACCDGISHFACHSEQATAETLHLKTLLRCSFKKAPSTWLHPYSVVFSIHWLISDRQTRSLSSWLLHVCTAYCVLVYFAWSASPHPAPMPGS
jgi:hypothetical protein